MKKRFVILFFYGIIACKTDKKKFIEKTSYPAEAIQTDRYSTSTGYVLRGNVLADINKERKKDNPAAPDIYIIDVDTINKTTTMYWNELSPKGTILIKSSTRF